jgi:hypothetical protein
MASASLPTTKRPSLMATALARAFTVNGMKLAIEQNQIGVHRVSLVWVDEDSQGANKRVAIGMNRYTTDNTMVRVIRKVATR